MAGVNKLTGTPWHVEKYTRKEGDNRRHRSRCVKYGGKDNPICAIFGGKCHGAAHCQYYKEAKPDLNLEKPEIKQPKIASEFEGVKMLPMKDIIVDSKIAKPPLEKKVKVLMEYYDRHGELDKPIVVSCQKNKYMLQDKYLRFYVAKKLGLQEIPAEMGSQDDIKIRDSIRKTGALVWHKKNKEVGEIIEVSLSQVTIKFDSGDVKKYDIHKALRSGIIRPM